ncbi:MAG: TRAP transporter large permease subunit, partial [Pseudomonadota bacterium]
MTSGTDQAQTLTGRIIGLIAVVMAAVILYLPSPIFPILSDNETYQALGWERRGEGSWNDLIGWLRGILRGFNRTLLDPSFIRPFFVASACTIAILTTTPWATTIPTSRLMAWLVNLFLVGLLAIAIWVLARKLSLGSDALFIPKTIDIIAAMCGVVVIVELVRRLAGWMMFILIIFAVLYMKWGDPTGLFYETASKTWDLLALNFWLETTGAMGFALSIMIQNVVIFILFGVIIQATGAADAILKIALVATRRLRGGPAHAAIVSSAMFGTFSGSAAANVVGTGTFTIPLIKSRGFSPRFAGGIEAAASTGGQITPPVMGAAAFYLAEQAQVPYNQVAVAVLLPALFYFASLFTAVEFQARKMDIRPAASEEIPRLERADWIKSLSFVAPLAAIIYCLAAGYSVNRAGFWAIFMTILFGLLNPEFRANPGRLVEKLKQGGIAVSHLLAIV